MEFYQLENFIDGKFVGTSSTMESVNPATGKVRLQLKLKVDLIKPFV